MLLVVAHDLLGENVFCLRWKRNGGGKYWRNFTHWNLATFCTLFT